MQPPTPVEAAKPINYRVNYEKAIETIVWLADQKPNIDIYHVAKILFYADKAHVNKYARPITGDNYICMEYGPVPSSIRDLITKNSWLNPIHLKEISEAIKVVDEPHPSIVALRKPDMDFFSESDIECLTESLNEYGDKSFQELFDLTHNEQCLLSTGINQPIDFTWLVDDTNPNKDEIIDEMSETSPYLSL